MKEMTRRTLAGTGCILLIGVGLALAGCSTPGSGAKAAEKNVAAMASGAELWAQNCGHCHNVRSPSSFSDAQWEVAMLHMRVRANLTADEHRQILAFLKSAH